jgi:hypothetical protein
MNAEEREELALSLFLYGTAAMGQGPIKHISMGSGYDPLGLTITPRVPEYDPWWKSLGFLPPSDVMRAAERAAQEPVIRPTWEAGWSKNDGGFYYHAPRQPQKQYKRWDDPTITVEEIIDQIRTSVGLLKGNPEAVVW